MGDRNGLNCLGGRVAVSLGSALFFCLLEIIPELERGLPNL